MPTFLWFYFSGLALALLVGVIYYFVIGSGGAALWRSLFGGRSGPLWGRSFRLMLVITAMVGGLSTQWYGCGGYGDYEAVKQDPVLMFQKTTEQVSGALETVNEFVVLAIAIATLCFAALWRSRPANGNGSPELSALPEKETSARQANRDRA